MPAEVHKRKANLPLRTIDDPASFPAVRLQSRWDWRKGGGGGGGGEGVPITGPSTLFLTIQTSDPRKRPFTTSEELAITTHFIWRGPDLFPLVVR